MDEFVSDKAYDIMEKKILNKDFIGKRGFQEINLTLQGDYREKRLEVCMSALAIWICCTEEGIL